MRRESSSATSRHDARKALRLLSDMADTLSIDNAKTIIEGINRETNALVNLLNDYRDTVEYFHEVNPEGLHRRRPRGEGRAGPSFPVRTSADGSYTRYFRTFSIHRFAESMSGAPDT